MNDEIRLDAALKRLGGDIDVMPSEDFMDSVWMRAGRMEEASVRRRRLVLMGLMMFVGLGAGFSTAPGPAYAGPAANSLIDGTYLSPASLLHVNP